MLEGGRLRGAEGPEGNPGRGWEEALLEAVKGPLGPLDSALLLGGGSGTLARILLRLFPEMRIHVVERSRELVRLAGSHLTPWDGWDRVTLQVGEILTTPLNSHGSFSMVVVDVGCLPSLGDAPFLRESDWRSWRRVLSDGGVLVLGGLHEPEGERSPGLEGLIRDCRTCFPGVGVYEAGSPASPAGLLPELDGAREIMVLASAGGTPWPASLSGFHLRGGKEV